MARKLAPRLRAFDYLGYQRYFLTICAFERRPAFIVQVHVDRVMLHLRQCTVASAFAILAYCFMPDHLHLLVEGMWASSDLRHLLRLWKQRTAFEWMHTTGEVLWQRGYYDRILRTDEDTAAVAEYILTNPIRAGLVSEIRHYPFLGSDTTSIEDLLTRAAEVRDAKERGRGRT